jgi:hypothetical protein
MEIDHKDGGLSVMKPEYPFAPSNRMKDNELSAPPASRLTDEKISDESDTEAITDSALKPAGLKNPFWN